MTSIRRTALRILTGLAVAATVAIGGASAASAQPVISASSQATTALPSDIVW
jgi:hypothetical protein